MVLPAKGESFYVCPGFEEGRAREQIAKSPDGDNADVRIWQERRKSLRPRGAGHERPRNLEGFTLAPWASRRDLLELVDRLTPMITELTQAVEQEADRCPVAQRLATHPGVGPLTALGAYRIPSETGLLIPSGYIN